ncbi:MAG TPA: RidA family protein [Acidimicrobiales bacterium]|nr:RidA family protein [Acidimicrobiales bacterium]
MLIDRLDPPDLAPIAGAANVVVASGNRLVFVSGQTGVDTNGKVVGTTHLDQSRRALTNLRTALRSAGATEADVAKLAIYVVDYGDAALEALMSAAIEVFGDDFPITASTLVGVATLWQPDLLIEIDAIAVV